MILEPQTRSALDVEEVIVRARPCPQNAIARLGNPCRPECFPQVDDQNKGCPGHPLRVLEDLEAIGAHD
jgi:hypothetical protein